MQQNWLSTGTGELSTPEYLQKSRQIKIPLTPGRTKNIYYLLEQLVRLHKEEIRPVFTFAFSINQKTKQLTVKERAEFTVLLSDKDLAQLRSKRDGESIENVNALIKKFRIFNIVKLIQRSKQKKLLSALIKSQIGTTLFNYKNYSLDHRGVEFAEDYCFHKDNFAEVKKRLNWEGIQKLIKIHQVAVDKRLKEFGILNSSFSNYQDKKLDYILETFLGQKSIPLDNKTLVEVKTFKSLRDCILKVDSFFDPVKQLHDDIINFIEERFIVTPEEIITNFEQLDYSELERWEIENARSSNIIIHRYENIKFMIDGKNFPPEYKNFVESVIYNEPNFTERSEDSQEDYLYQIDILTEVAEKMLKKESLTKNIFPTGEVKSQIKELIESYQSYKRMKLAQEESNKQNREKRSFWSAVINAIVSIFTGKRKKEEKSQNQSHVQDINQGTYSNVEVAKSGSKKKKPLSRTAVNFYNKIKTMNAIIIPLSDIIEIKPENEKEIDRLIEELRENGIKIVIPIYNAKKVLYPLRSKKFLTADAEYLLVDPAVTSDPDSIRSYTDSLVGYKFKEDTISQSALVTIEKYLMTTYRKSRARSKRLRALKKK